MKISKIVEEINAIVRHESEEYDDLRKWIDEQPDVEYIVNRRGEYDGAKIYITLGGPTAWYDTRSGKVVVAYDESSIRGWASVCEAAKFELDDLLADDWEIVRGC